MARPGVAVCLALPVLAVAGGLPLALSLGSIGPLMKTIIGLGLVIFFHELGHFAVAKWCDVYVEGFSLGFGPAIWAKKWGETEYAIRIIPFGGYVRMLGQDDSDPSQMVNEDLAEDPRSYSAKNVPKRMAIISAGVLMNLITALLFFGTAFFIGVDQRTPVIGFVAVGQPAWEQGIRPGDTITEINGQEVTQFADIMRGTALSRGVIDIKGRHRDGSTYAVAVMPDASGTKRMLGVGMPDSLQIGPTTRAPAIPGSAAAAAFPQKFDAETFITAVDGSEVSDYFDLVDRLAESRDQTVTLSLRNEKGKEWDVDLPPQPLRELGLRFDVGKIAAVREGSVAKAEGLKRGDRLSKVDGKAVGPDLDPFLLPDYLASKASEPVTLTVLRDSEGGKPKEVEFTVTPERANPFLTPPMMEDSPLAIPSLGTALELIPKVLAVDENGPAAAAGVKPGETVKAIELTHRSGEPEDGLEAIKQVALSDNGAAYALWLTQRFPSREVTLLIADAQGSERRVTIAPRPSETQFLTNDRGLMPFGAKQEVRVDSVGGAVAMSLKTVKDNAKDIYLTLRNLFTGDLSVKELQGPIGIATTAYEVAKIDWPQFLTFLGMLSVNLAVINFLPIPMLDGGHMLFLFWEAVFRKPPPEKVQIAATYCGLFFVLGLMAMVIFLDINRVFSG